VSEVVAIQPEGAVPRVLRLRYSKTGKIRFTSHRDVSRMWERALRKIALAVAYTSGFSPRPRIAFGFALPTGAESLAEYVDVALDPTKEHDLVDITSSLTPAMPNGIELSGAAVLEPPTEALQAAVVSSTWEMVPPDSPDLAGQLARLLSQATIEIEVERKGVQVASDIRPGIITGSVDGHVITCELAARGTRPADVMRALDLDPLDTRFLRIHQWIEHEDGRAEPLAAGAALPSGVLREEPTDNVRPEPFSVAESQSTPPRLARGA